MRFVVEDTAIEVSHTRAGYIGKIGHDEVELERRKVVQKVGSDKGRLRSWWKKLARVGSSDFECLGIEIGKIDMVLSVVFG